MITFEVRKTFLKKLRTLCNLVGFWLAGNRNGIQSTTNFYNSSISLFRLFCGGWKFPVFSEKKIRRVYSIKININTVLCILATFPLHTWHKLGHPYVTTTATNTTISKVITTYFLHSSGNIVQKNTKVHYHYLSYVHFEVGSSF